MKTIKLIIVLLTLFPTLIYSKGLDSTRHNLEIAVYNYTHDTIEIMLHPISMLMNGNYYYSLIEKNRL